MGIKGIPGQDRPLEAEFQAEGVDWLKSQGSLVFRRNTGAFRNPQTGKLVRFSEKGASDTWLITPAGVHGEVEWKRENERPTLDQVLWLVKTNGHGHSFSFWVDNMTTLQRVYRAVVNDGRKVVYLNTTRTYTTKKGKAIGLSGDFDLVSDLFRS
jgi:hypothetical protein